MDFGSSDQTERSVSELARGLVGSEILRIGAEIGAQKRAGRAICDLTVGDFDPTFFPIPDLLREGVARALAEGHTNYPPSDGVLALREAVSKFYETQLGLPYPIESVLIASGARPLLYATFRALVDPGDLVLYPVPSWNNDHYVHLSSARAVEIPVDIENNFFPRAEDFDPHLAQARLIVLCSPLNPTGTVIDPEVLRAICERVVSENARRARRGAKGLWLCFDQVYWQLTIGDVRHVTPPGVMPEVAPYTVLVDAASKSYAATGLRIGWGLMPPTLRGHMADIIGHMGAWSPRAEQMAMARLLAPANAPVLDRYRARMIERVKQRLDRLAQAFRAMKAEGLPVETAEPQGAIYLSVRMRKDGLDDESMRRHLLDAAGIAVIPFRAFGQRADTGWFRLSVGAVSLDDIEAAVPRLRAALVGRDQETHANRWPEKR